MTRAIQIFVGITVLAVGWRLVHLFDPGFSLIHDTTPRVAIANINTPGQPTDITQYRVARKLTVIEFYSGHCRLCRDVDKALRVLVTRRSDLVLRIVDIDRPRSGSIDIGSPLAIQYGVTHLPAFVVYDRSGRKLPGGDAIVARWLREEFGTPDT